ncbi:hypothetical protein Poli38472_008542 [Pythium oligandrum]|uniref:DnaJ homologue subfamily C GRV2/DNAJC13 N-terminal domain-containing protein n=1 Tax=Pythium oligandrum TaxID=41045 RepID=A0A8K1C3S0_PYTOL|nr:hypothetical protein Poli38472_008542 [Pythium oligandrum]|eukprot:TMW55894.1 hypothetical protein Poli38472_008542 [Pythium oligandrum]
MGQAGSVEQRNAIRAVVSIKPSSDKLEKDAIVTTLQTFCQMFPAEEASVAMEDGGPVDVKERKLFDVIHALLQHLTERTEKNSHEDLIELTLVSFKRVILWRELYRLGARCSMKPFLNCVLLSPKLALSVVEVLLQLVGVCPGDDGNEKTEKWETLNRRNFADAGGYDVLRSLIVQHSTEAHTKKDQNMLLTRVLELFHLTLVRRKQTTDILTCTQAVNALLVARISLLELCHHTDKAIQEYAIDLIKEIFFLIDLGQVHELQESAREYGALLYALSAAVQGRRSNDAKDDKAEAHTPTDSSHEINEKCIDLVEMFCAGNTRSKKAMSRIFPVELFIPAESRADLMSRHTASSLLKNTRANRSLPSFSFDFELRSNTDTKRNRVTSLAGNAKAVGGGAFEKWLQEARSQGEDWRSIIEAALETHERPELVWREPMREELRQALGLEITKLEMRKKSVTVRSPGTIAHWDHEMFYVHYESIHRELVVNGYFVEHLTPILADMSNQFEVVDPLVLAWHLSDRLAVEEDERWKIMCLRCLRLVIRRYAMILHGQLPIRQVIAMLGDHSKFSVVFIRECFLLLNTAIMTTRNAQSASLNRLNTLVVNAVVDVLSDSFLIGSLSRLSATNESEEVLADFDEEEVHVRNPSDGLVRAGVSVLQAILRRAKYTLQLIRPKRVFICRLLAVETLDHVTVNRILLILKQLAQLEESSLSPVVSASIHAPTKPAVDANWKSLALVYILIASCDPRGRGMCLSSADFLKEHYADAQASIVINGSRNGKTVSGPSSAKKRSEFTQLLDDAVGFEGCGMGSLLSSYDAAAFCKVFNAEETKAADVLWGQRHRSVLFGYLKRKFASTGEENNHSENNGEDEVYSERSALEADDLFVGNIFLRSFIEGDGAFLNYWSPDTYKALIHALFARLIDLSRTKSVFGVNKKSSLSSANTEPWEIQMLILKALVKLLPTHGSSTEIKSDYYEALLLPLRRSLLGETDQVRGTLAIELMIAVLSVPEEKSNNSMLCREYLEAKGLNLLGEALEKMLNPAYQQLLKADEDPTSSNSGSARALLYRITDLLTTLTGQQEGIAAIVKNPRAITPLLDLSSRHTIMQFSEDAASVGLSCLANLCRYEELRALIVNAGGLLVLIDTCVFCPIEDVAHSPSIGSGSDDGTADGIVVVQREPSRFTAAVRAAAITLRVCLSEQELSDSEQPPKSPGSSSSYQVMKQLLTPSFLRILRHSPEKFVAGLQSSEDINSSTLIWTSAMRKKLGETLSTELAKVKAAARAQTWPRWNPDHFIAADSFRYQYPTLSDELIVHDVYINHFVASEGIALEYIDMSAFSQALLISIQSSENVLRILQQRGATDPTKERSIVVMRLALNKLVSTHPQHNLEVSPTPPTAMGMASLIEAESSDESDDDGSSIMSPLPMEQRESATTLERTSSLDIEDLTV